ncbi:MULTISPECIES: hypothetical protein [unclassified Asaia]|uniref:hypothetical protein n=1 Tax=unclassified Asaia TaxID=2685023 RepID=UPI000F8C6A19|nr:hypothetical protein [Asaia sp. W19]
MQELIDQAPIGTSSVEELRPYAEKVANEKLEAQNLEIGGLAGSRPQWDQTESPALNSSPYDPDTVQNRVKPPYRANPAHDPKSPLYNPRKSPEPHDAEEVYEHAIRGGDTQRSQKAWYGKGEGGYYQFFYDNAGTVHFSGVIPQNELPKGLYRILNEK